MLNRLAPLLLLLAIAAPSHSHAQELTQKQKRAKAKTASSPSADQANALPAGQKIESLINAPVSEELRHDLQMETLASRWRLGAGYAPILGMQANFSAVSDFQAVPNVAGQNRQYLDGYVKVDSSGNAGGETTFWGYGSDSQEVGGNIEFQSIDSRNGPVEIGNASDSSVAAAAGFEIYSFYEMGKFNVPALKNKEATWGFRLGAQYAHVDLHHRSSTRGTVSTFTDSFSLGGLFAPGAGFAGTFFGPNQTLSDVADTRTFGGSANVRAEGRRHLDVHLAISQWGSYVQIPVRKGLDVVLEGGVLLALASGTYEHTTTASLNASGGQTSRGRTQRTRFLPGFYAGLGLTCELTPHVSLMTNLRYQFLRSYELSSSGSKADLDSSGAFVLGLSVLWKF